MLHVTLEDADRLTGCLRSGAGGRGGTGSRIGATFT
jgi:hypothetical protein